MSTTKNELQDNETSGVTAPLWSESEESSTEPQPALLTAAGVIVRRAAGTWLGPAQRREGKQRSCESCHAGRTGPGISGHRGNTFRRCACCKRRCRCGQSAHGRRRAVHTREPGAASAWDRRWRGESRSTSHPVVAQPSGAAADASAWVRNPVGAHEALSAASSVAAGATGTQDITAREAIASLDAAPAVGTPGWLHAASRQAEAGFQDPALGWVGVRADLNGGIVHATVVTSSSEAAQALSGHLPGLSSYLTEQQTPVATLTVTTSGGSGLEAGVDQNMQQSAGQNAEQGARQVRSRARARRHRLCR